jgi:hypothetical protein
VYPELAREDKFFVYYTLWEVYRAIRFDMTRIMIPMRVGYKKVPGGRAGGLERVARPTPRRGARDERGRATAS